jgi:nucleotide-binding universal stress UspA family protein
VIDTRILVPLDGSERALAACGPARRLARLHGATLGLVTVAGPDATSGEIHAIIEAGRLAMGDVATEAVVVRGSESGFDARPVRPGTPRDAAVPDDPGASPARPRAARQPRLGLLAVSTATAGLADVVDGSVAAEVVRGSSVPVMVARHV